MAKITGLGGVFFKSPNRDETARFFTEKLGLPTEAFGHVFPWRDREDPSRKGYTVMGLFPEQTDYFTRSALPFMVNLRVDDLEGMLAQVERNGLKVLRRFDPEPNGKFAHIEGPDGMTIELWEPVENDPYDP